MRKKESCDWVVVGGRVGESAHCKNCGEGLVLGFPVAVTVFIAATKAFGDAHKQCKDKRFTEPIPKNPTQWAHSRDVGTSAFTIWSVMTGMPTRMESFDIPYDPADFGRCYRLLNLFPEWKPRLKEVANIHPRWTPFVAAWDHMTELYERDLPSGKCEELYSFMQKLVEEVRAVRV